MFVVKSQNFVPINYYCGITYFRPGLVFVYFALWPMREFKTAQKISHGLVLEKIYSIY